MIKTMRYWNDATVSEVALIDPDGFSAALRRKYSAKKLFPHMGLGYLAASLERNGDRVRVLDSGVSTYREVQRFLSQPANLYGITAVSFTFREALNAARAAKHRYPSVPVLLGGPHVSIDPEGCLQDPAVDYALRGEAEEIIIDLLEVLKRNTTPAPEVLSRIPGLIYRNKGKVHVNPATPRIRNLDELPYPAWHLFRMNRYQQHPLLTSRGCSMNCCFCAVEAIWGKQCLLRDVEQVVSEMAWLEAQWGHKLIHINDDNLTLSAKHVHAFCDTILRSKLQVNWVAQGVRADAVNPEILDKMRRAGCHRVSLGIESVDAGVLEAVGKKETPDDMARAVRLCQAAGIQVLGMFMVGNPGDTEETVERSLRFAKNSRIDLPAFYMALPYPRTRLCDYAAEQGTFLNSDYLSFTHMSAEPVFETQEFSAEARRRIFRKSQKFCRKQYRLYHLKFWWPPRLWQRNRYEIMTEIALLIKVVRLPFKLMRQARHRRKGETAA